MKQKGVYILILQNTKKTCDPGIPIQLYVEKRYPYKNSSNALSSFMRINKKIDRTLFYTKRKIKCKSRKKIIKF
jgi:hypothetical protein